MSQLTLLSPMWTGEEVAFPSTDKHGNVYWIECQEQGCTWRTKPHEDKGGGAFAGLEGQRHAESHGREGSTIGWPNSWARIYVGGSPADYIAHRHHVKSRRAPADEDEEAEIQGGDAK